MKHHKCGSQSSYLRQTEQLQQTGANMILYGKQCISDADINAVVDVLKNSNLTQGPKIKEFEKAISDYTNCKFAVAVNSATSALHIANLALGVGPGDLVWTSPITFVASANSALYCGASIDFVDVDITTGNMCTLSLAAKLAQAKQQGRLPKVVIPVHLAGHSCDMEEIDKLAKIYGFRVIEDASHAIGGSFNHKKIGACEFSDICVFSFHPVKIITTAEGGLATTNDPELAKTLMMLRSHGITKEQNELVRLDEGDWYYEQHSLGFNYRITDLQAALGLSQLKSIDSFTARRNTLSGQYRKLLKEQPLDIVEPLHDCFSARHLQIIKLHDESIRRSVFDTMRARGIQVHVHYFPVHLQPFYTNLGFKEGDFPKAELFYKKILTLPLHPQLSEDEIDFVCSNLIELLH